MLSDLVSVENDLSLADATGEDELCNGEPKEQGTSIKDETSCNISGSLEHGLDGERHLYENGNV